MRALVLLTATYAVLHAQAPQQDLQMQPDAHAPLFRSKTPQAGKVTERITADLTRPAVPIAKIPYRNFIDEEIFGRMRRDSIPHAPLTTDREFIRRAKLDIAGRIPSSVEVREFLADASPAKREKLVEQLVKSPEWVDKWSYFLMDIWRANGKMGRGIGLFHYALKESLAADRPYDDWARSIIAASAKSNYVVASANPIVREHVEGKPGEAAHGDDLSKINQIDTHDELTILYGKIFLGINLSCISCHDGQGHLEKVNTYLAGKTRSDFFRESAFLAKTRYIPHIEKKEAIMGHFLVDDGGDGYDTKKDSMLRPKRSGGLNTPKFILTDEVATADADPRQELGDMLTAHPQFARATVNLFWSKLMGVGIVDPPDDFDLAKPDQASHPELLEKLTQYFRENNYSLHKLFNLICNSSAYQLSARFPGEWKEAYTKYYARKFVRMLSAEELHDAIASATERPARFVIASAKEDGSSDGGAAKTVGMAMQVSMPRPSGELKTFMAAFGESNRNTPPHAPTPSPLQPIMMMRSSVVNDRVLAKKDSRVQRLLDSYSDNGKVVEELFMATLSRLPLASEKALVLDAMAKDRVSGAENAQWALLNLVEFLYNL